MMNKTKIRKIGAIILIVLGILIFVAYSVELILYRLSLPPWSVQTEGKYVAYGLKVWRFLWSLPIIISLFLLAYLIHPSKFEKFSTIIKILFVLLAIGGFGVAAPLILAIINNPSAVEDILNTILFSILGTSPFWVMGILSVIALKKDKFEKIRREYKLTIFMIIGAIITINLLNILYALWLNYSLLGLSFSFFLMSSL